MKIVVRILIVLAVIVAALLGYGMTLPSEYAFERKTVIKASPEQVHAVLNDLKRWDSWGPWKEEDPEMKVTIGEKSSGVGASQSWTGKDGNGSLVFTKESPTEGIEYDLKFDDYSPSKCGNHYKVVDGGTEVSWFMKTDVGGNPIARLMFTVLSDSINEMYDKGLSKLKLVVEADVAKAGS